MEGAAITQPTILEEYVASFREDHPGCVYKSAQEALRDKFARDNEFPLPSSTRYLKRRNDGVPFEEHRSSIKRSAAGNSGKRFRSAYCAGLPPPSSSSSSSPSINRVSNRDDINASKYTPNVCLETRHSIHFPWDSILLSGGG